jgi:hypothetical protein
MDHFFFSIKNVLPKKGAYQPMNMNPYFGFRKAVNFKPLFFFNYSDVVQRIKVKNI